jgi:hypothetical protein
MTIPLIQNVPYVESDIILIPVDVIVVIHY